MASLQNKLKAIQDLKRDYGISSRDAILYLRLHNVYSEAHLELVQRLRASRLLERLGYTPSVKEIANVAEEIEFGLEQGLLETSDEQTVRGVVSLAEIVDCAKVNRHKFITIDKFDREDIHDSGKEHQGNELKLGISWVEALEDYYDNRISGDNERQAIVRAVFRILEYDDQFKVSCPLYKQHFYSALKAAEKKEKKKKIMSIHFLLYAIHGLDYWVKLPNYGLSLRDRSPHYDRLTLLDCLGYERAEKEHTLRQIWTERRIALNALKGAQSMYSKVDDVINTTLKNLDFLKMSCKRLDDISNTRGREYRKKELIKLNYERTAILKNRPWLERFLSR